MYIVVVKNKVKENCVEAYYEVSKRFAEDMKSVKGCKDAYVLKVLTIQMKSQMLNIGNQKKPKKQMMEVYS